MPLVILLLCILGLVATPLVATTTRGAGRAGAVTYAICAAVSVVALAAAASQLLSPAPITLRLPIGLPWLGANFRLDPLAAFFLVVVNLGGAAASIFAIRHVRHEHASARVLPFYPVFLAAMNLVALADDAFTFLLAWGSMSLLSWALVLSDDKISENLRAGFVYIVMAEFGTLALLLAFGILAGPAGDYSFAGMQAHTVSANQTLLVLLLVLAGTGSKAGLVPLHVWLPLAHPAAPSHVSALMSGVMTKIAVYAFVRIMFTLAGPVGWQPAMIVIALGAITAVLGVLYALMQHDLKRLLAYHTVENIGIIFTGLGLALAFKADALSMAAALAFTAALFHVFNHSVFKNLLFLGSGAVLASTGERDMNQLGGLIHRMPRTALLFLIGSAAISALPPLNGFASEWMLLQSVFLSPGFPQWGLRILVPASGAMLALAAALAAACFVKAFGVTFLGRPRSPAAEQAIEADPFSRAAMTFLAVLCVVAGIVPGFFTSLLGPASQMLLHSRLPAQDYTAPFSPLIPFAGNPNSYGGFAIAAVLLAALSLTALATRLMANRATRRSAAWDCGYPDPSPATQYSAESFAQPIRRVFGTTVFGAREHISMPPPNDRSPARLEVTIHDPVWEMLYIPLAASVGYLSERANVLQFLTIRRYLGLVFLALVTLLLVLALWL